MRSSRRFKPLSVIPGAKALVISPHCDDETIGCGGLLAKSASKGIDISVVFVACSENPGDAVSKLRLSEAERACSKLGVSSIESYGLPIRSFSSSALASHLARSLATSQPDTILMPWYGDGHRDHWLVNQALIEAFHQTPDSWLHLRVLAYEVWTPLPANRLADVTDEMPIKLSALANYASQLQRWRYVEMVTALNAFRAANSFPPLYAGIRFAEGYLDYPLAEYIGIASSEFRRERQVG